MGYAERQGLIQEIEGRRSSKLLCYVTSDRPNANAEIKKDVKPRFFEHLNRMGSPTNVDVFLFSQGGETIAAFGLARLVREFADCVGVLVPDQCHSAATLFALGANQIVMTRAASLSPIDPNIRSPLGPVLESGQGQRQIVPLSVESVAGFKDLVMEEWQIKSEDALAAILRVLTERVHPLALGDVFRVRQQIEQLATSLMTAHRQDSDRVRDIVDILTKRLGSHDYLISRREARELLGSQVAADDLELEDLIRRLYDDYAGEMELGEPFNPDLLVQTAQARGEPLPVQSLQRLAVVESATHSDVAERHLRLAPIRAQIGPGQTVDGVQSQITFAGWRRYEGTP